MGTQVSNPIVIMLINMTIVFAVLFVLSLYIRLIHKIDPTAKPAPAAPKVEAPKAAAPAPAAKPEVQKGIAGETVAAIAAALASVGIGFSQVKAIRVADRPGWTNAARNEGLTSLKMKK
ncbi:MAG: glutaconyl-CoA decarboxylase subunit delta [Anaerovibrio sp.]|uniref:OadG family protein n=1 Tax=Anaerovibrio sp. TaxID=1872532 RepID=UPI0025C3885C|nr:OadG family protein [Anaerovibrio sp.]MBE6099702.1 glutaconyl-CoA decarboxylase subunit delta [Anaerovibrio sp.]